MKKYKERKIVIADISGAEKNGFIAGHMLQVAKDYYYALSKYCNVKIAGQKKYSNYFNKNDLIELPYINDNATSGKIIRKYREFLNACFILKRCEVDESIVFQQYSRNTMLYLAILFTYPKSKVFLIQYYLKDKGHVGKIGRIIDDLLFICCIL